MSFKWQEQIALFLASRGMSMFMWYVNLRKHKKKTVWKHHIKHLLHYVLFTLHMTFN